MKKQPELESLSHICDIYMTSPDDNCVYESVNARINIRSVFVTKVCLFSARMKSKTFRHRPAGGACTRRGKMIFPGRPSNSTPFYAVTTLAYRNGPLYGIYRAARTIIIIPGAFLLLFMRRTQHNTRRDCRIRMFVRYKTVVARGRTRARKKRQKTNIAHVHARI